MYPCFIRRNYETNHFGIIYRYRSNGLNYIFIGTYIRSKPNVSVANQFMGIISNVFCIGCVFIKSHQDIILITGRRGETNPCIVLIRLGVLFEKLSIGSRSHAIIENHIRSGFSHYPKTLTGSYVSSRKFDRISRVYATC